MDERRDCACEMEGRGEVEVMGVYRDMIVRQNGCWRGTMEIDDVVCDGNPLVWIDKLRRGRMMRCPCCLDPNCPL